jgi:hypothetical protein
VASREMFETLSQAMRDVGVDPDELRQRQVTT